MNKSFAFMLSVFPMMFGTLFILLQYCIIQGWIPIGQQSNAGNAFFATFVFAFLAGAYAMIICDWLTKLK